jgi:surface antigen
MAAALALAAAGCSSSMPLGSILPGISDERLAEADTEEPTGALSLRERKVSAEMTGADWIMAKAALGEALDRKEDGPALEWQNPITASRGTVSPITAAFEQDGFHCRNFLVSHRRSGRETWHEGTACRTHRGKWDVQSTRPIQRS